MASIHRLPSGLWRVQIARAGVRKSASFPTKSAAQQWATQVEAELLAGKRGDIPRRTVRDALDRYAADVSPTKRGARWEILRLGAFGRETWSSLWLSDLNAPVLAQWRDRRLLGVTSGSVRRDMNLLQSVMTRARREWRWLDHDPFEGFVRPADNRARTQRIGWREIRAIVRSLGYPGNTKSAEVARAWLIGLHTGMRAGEILSLTPSAVDLKRRIAKLTNTKNGDDRDVPFTTQAARLFRNWAGWTVSAASLDALFRKARDRCKASHLHFHDARAFALTRLSRKVDVLTLARISGHRDVGLLSRVYYRVTAESIAQRLG